MGAIVKACNNKTSVRNTGLECSTAMVATAMLIAIDESVTWTDADLLDPVAWMTGLIHQRLAFPIFGQKAPIRTVTNANDSDVTITMDDGTVIFVRYGVYNRTFATTEGGLCYAASLQSFNRSRYRILEIDQLGQMLQRKNDDGTYAGMIMSFMYAPSPTLADLKSNVYTNRFQISYNPEEMVFNGVIMKGAQPLLSMMGLIDVVFTKPVASTTTKLKIGVVTDCANADLLALFATQMPLAGNFVVKNAAGTVISVTSAAIVSGVLELTGTFPAGVYTVTGTAPTVWKTNGIIGYDGTVNTVTITVA